jgi:hypothetical protein
VRARQRDESKLVGHAALLDALLSMVQHEAAVAKCQQEIVDLVPQLVDLCSDMRAISVRSCASPRSFQLTTFAEPRI